MQPLKIPLISLTHAMVAAVNMLCQTGVRKKYLVCKCFISRSETENNVNILFNRDHTGLESITRNIKGTQAHGGVRL